MRICKKCEQTKLLIDFNVDRKRRDGLHPYCKSCQSEYSKNRRDVRKANSVEVVEEKICPACKEVKSREMFNLDPSNLSGLSSICKRCRKSRKLQDEFGIDMDQYDIMYTEQLGKCKICKKRCGSGRSLAVDHCHTTGKVRGLLCIRCNNALGALEDNVEVMNNMIRYIEESVFIGA